MTQIPEGRVFLRNTKGSFGAIFCFSETREGAESRNPKRKEDRRRRE
jgi:hypothetical protein